MELVVMTKKGIYCPKGDFFIDPKSSVKRAVITHVHSDHATRGSDQYYCSSRCEELLKYRLGKINVLSFDYGEVFNLGEVRVTLFPAGHILGSSQVRIEYGEEVWVISGDYKRADDLSCDPFMPVKCNTFISETTFALPIYQWPDVKLEIKRLYKWWEDINRRGKWGVIHLYSVGKAQRIMAELRQLTDRVIYVSKPIFDANKIYNNLGVNLGNYEILDENILKKEVKKREPGLLLSSSKNLPFPSVNDYLSAHTSGWLINPFKRRLYGCDEGFTISDHADWPSLLRTCKESGASRVIGYHGRGEIFEKHLGQEGIETRGLEIESV